MRHSQNVRKRIALTLLTISAIVASPVLATNFGSAGSTGSSGTTNGVFLTDDWYMVVIRRNLTAAMSNFVDSTLFGDFDAYTDMGVSVLNNSSCTGEICVYDEDYGDNGLLGWNACHSGASGSHPNMRCGVDYVRYNLHYTQSMYNACHELGHSVGLRHTSAQDSCLKRAIDGGNSDWLSWHDADHLNATY